MLTKEQLIEQINLLRTQKNAVIMAHYYQRAELQDIADFVGDSLALARQAAKTDADIIVLCGVHFMGETAKIICPNKKVLIPDPQAGCSLADSCKAEELAEWKQQHPEYMVVSYVNTSAAVKALTDIVVTSSNALKIVKQLPEDQPILFAPDKNLGNYINSITGRNMALWDGACHVHSRFSVQALLQLKKDYPQAKVLAHPECKKIIVDIADVVGSTEALLNYAKNSDENVFIVATESGILHKMQLSCPQKTLIAVPPEATEIIVDGKLTPCSCNECEYMRLNTLQKLYECLRDEKYEIKVDSFLAQQAIKPIEKMLRMS
ncbi:MAG: quinolinate synthase NadA [Paludibacteraceae bacterium]|nr:quinolinate synthase NadA [Paludibacteraceae bacterium]